MNENESTPLEFEVPQEAANERLDAWLAAQIELLSRNRVQGLIAQGAILLDGLPVKSSHRLKPGERIEVELPPPEEAEPKPEAIPLDIIFEDDWLLVINKPAGMVVHPAPGHSTGTLVNALLHHCTDLSGIGGVRRPGIIHRLDADTTGLMIVAKNDASHQGLAHALERREISRKYIAVVAGQPRERAGTIDAPIGRSRSDRLRMTIDPKHGRTAVTHWEVELWGHGLTVLRLRLETGRTHQIRVHLAARNHPVIGDRIYGWPARREMEMVPHQDSALIQALSHVQRQMLHAAQLDFAHPRTKEALHFEAPIPADMAALIERIQPLETMGNTI